MCRIHEQSGTAFFHDSGEGPPVKAEEGRRAFRESCCGNPLVAELRGIPCNRRILLVGNPNVGKSVLFTRLTGVHAISSNYPGTTVGFSEGRLAFGNSCFHLIDVPGAYTLDPTNEAEEVARRIVDEGAEAVIVVLDSTALERNLYLALQVLERGLPVVVALNMVDEARHKGIAVDAAALAEALGVPVVPTVAVTGQGINELVRALEERTRRAAPEAHSPAQTTPPATLRSAEERWLVIGNVIQQVQRVTHRHHTWRDKLEDASVDRIWGGLIALAVILGSYSAIRFLGEGLIDHLLDPLANRLLLPLLGQLSAALGGEGLLHHILIGRLVDGAIDFEQSFGMLTTGLYVEFVMVLPYVTAFYTVLSFLEDFGYLPRLAVFFDALLHRLGLHGFAIIPTLLGLGCNVPGILATRVLESPRERFIAATLISVAVPCAGLQAMAVGVLGDLGGQYVLIPYAVLAVSWVILGRILHLILPGYSP
jgi:ferrous iron transport protein B